MNLHTWMIALGLGLGLGACGESAPLTADAAPDQTADAGACVDGVLVSGQLVDIDSTTANPIPVVGAQVGPTVTDAQGRFAACMPCVPVEAGPYRMLVDAPGDYLDGDLYIEVPTGGEGRPFRTMTAARATSLYAEHGLTFDAAAGQILELQMFDSTQITVDATYDGAAGAVQAEDGGLTWLAEPGGHYILFGNVDTASSSVRLNEAPSAEPDILGRRYHDIAVSPGRLSLVGTTSVYL